MDLTVLIDEYLAWCSTNQDAYKVTKDSSIQFEEILSPFQAASDELKNIADSGDKGHVVKISNTPTLNGFAVWYNYVKNV